MKQFLDSILEKQCLKTLERLECGALTFVAPDGRVRRFVGPQPGPQARLELHDWGVLRRALARGDIAFGEDYVAGAWDADDLEAVVELFLRNPNLRTGYANGGFLCRLLLTLHNKFVRRNSLAGSRRNIEAHYDVGNDFYALWLDRSMTYSSALFQGRTNDLEQAQANKYNRILSRIDTANATVLEIGCGWGGFAEKAATAGHRLTGLTISPAQYRFATNRLNGTADIRLEDYRHIQGVYDAIVSIEMFEAVGEQYWPHYFRTLAARLKCGGRAIVQTIAIRDDLFADYRRKSDFVRHYVFPGGMLPSFARFREEAVRAGLKVADCFAFGKDYAQTLRAWSIRMAAQKDKILALGHDEKFYRNWQYYLNACAGTFRTGRTDVAQIELTHV